MSHRTLRTAMVAACGLLAGAAFSQTLKPGLWEINNKMQTGTGEMEAAMAQAQAQMASLPPAQRKMMEDMMAKQGVGMTPGGGTAARVCMSREMIDQGAVSGQQQGDCKTNLSPRTGNTMKMTYVCTKPPSTGEGTITYTSPEAYAMKMKINTQVNGKPETMTVDAQGKWLSADCGAIRPLMPPKK